MDDKQLSRSYSDAKHQLRKRILFTLVVETGRDICFQCGERIVNVDDFSIEHKEPWRSAASPETAFFDLENIAFSHLRCNVKAGGWHIWDDAESCQRGHVLSEKNIYINHRGVRECRACRDMRNQARAKVRT